MPNPGEVLSGRYQILQLLGSGGFGQTFLAEDKLLPSRSRCVVKQLHPRYKEASVWQEALARFHTEAITLQRLGIHEQIPQLLAHFQENQEFYLVQEYIEGSELRNIVEKKVLSENEVVQLLKDVLQALDFVHGQQVIHRDIKPSNLIKRLKDARWVLIDFGAVKEITTIIPQGDGQTFLTKAIGTPGFMPSEQQQGKPLPSSDIYALGCTAIFALTGQYPTQFENHQTGEMDRWQYLLVNVNKELIKIIEKMVVRSLSERYLSTREVLEDLEPFLKVDSILNKRYKITQYLGGTNWSNTYRGHNISNPSNTACIIKQIKCRFLDANGNHEAQRRFHQEMDTLEKLEGHSQIPEILDNFEENEDVYIVHSYVLGETLKEELARKGRLSEQESITILADVLVVLDFIHQRQVIHRDIKPSNLVHRNSDGKILLIDFGIVKEIFTHSRDSRGNYITQAFDNNSYMPPEQIAGIPRYNSDIYALGMTIIELLTGKPPDQLKVNLQTGEIVWHKEIQVAPRITRILEKMIALDPSKRYQKASQILKALSGYQINSVTRILPESFPRAYNFLWVLPTVTVLLVVIFYITTIKEIHFIFEQADLKLASQEFEASIKYYDQGINKKLWFSNWFVNYEKALLQKAKAQSSLKDYSSMLTSCDQAIKISDDSVYPLICKGIALDGLMKEEDAIGAYNKALTIKPNSFEALNNRGYVYLKIGQIEAAIQDLQKAIQVEPSQAHVPWNQLGIIYFQQKKYDKAIEAYEEALKVKPDYLPAMIGLGNAYGVTKKYPEAITIYDKALQIDPKYLEAWYGKALVYEGLREYAQALEAFERAIFIKPDYKAALEGRKRVQEQLR